MHSLATSRHHCSVQESGLLGIIESIYEATLSPDHWPVVVECIVDAVGGDYGMFHLRDRRTHAITLNEDARVDPGALELYKAHFYKTDPWLLRGMSRRGTFVANGPDLVPTHTLHTSEFYNDFCKPNGGCRLLTAVPVQTEEIFSYISIFRSERKEEFESDAMELMRLLLPHLDRACRITMKLEGHKAGQQGANAVLDRLPIGVIFLDDTQHIVTMNRMAEQILGQADGLKVRRGCLEAAVAHQSTLLRNLVNDATHMTLGAATDAEASVSISRPSMKRPLAVLVLPICDLEVALPFYGVKVVLFLTDPELKPPLPVKMLARLHGLTLAEARLARALAQGLSVKEYAEKSELSLNTARWTLKQVLSKTDTRRQAELVKLLLTSPALLARG